MSIISSKLQQQTEADVIFIGTHIDQIEDKEHKENVCKKALLYARDLQNLKIVDKKYINATVKNSKELEEITKSCENLGKKVHNAMVSSAVFFFL